VILDDARLPRLFADLRELLPDAFWSVERPQKPQKPQNMKRAILREGYHPGGRHSRRPLAIEPAGRHLRFPGSEGLVMLQGRESRESSAVRHQ
jgi:hypothetical protein